MFFFKVDPNTDLECAWPSEIVGNNFNSCLFGRFDGVFRDGGGLPDGDINIWFSLGDQLFYYRAADASSFPDAEDSPEWDDWGEFSIHDGCFPMVVLELPTILEDEL